MVFRKAIFGSCISSTISEKAPPIIFVQESGHFLRGVAYIGGPDCFVGILGTLPGAIDIRFRRTEALSVSFGDKVTGSGQGFFVDPGRIGPHIGDQAGRSFFSCASPSPRGRYRPLCRRLRVGIHKCKMIVPRWKWGIAS